jgi:O-phosphoseryl-tRNA(Cys) synthetase
MSLRAIMASYRSAVADGDDLALSRRRALHLLDLVAIEIRGVRDPELHALVAQAREEVETANR